MVQPGRWHRGPQWCWAPTGSRTLAANARRATLAYHVLPSNMAFPKSRSRRACEHTPSTEPTLYCGEHRNTSWATRSCRTGVVQVTVDQAEAWCRARGAVYLEMRGPEDVGAVSLAIDLLVRACVCPVAYSAA